jgi:Ca2+-binding RTX toxin-like protein
MAYVPGTIGDDTLDGTVAGDLIVGFEGNDILRGLDGADTLQGDDGADSLYGGAGDDSLDGGAGYDVLWDIDGANTLKGGGGDDFLAAAGSSRLIGGGGSDQMVGFAVGGTTTRFDGGNGFDLAIMGVRDFNQAVDARVSVSGDTVTYSGTQGGQEFKMVGSNLEAFYVTGSNLGDRIVGSSASDYIIGGYADPNNDDEPGFLNIVADIGGDTLSGGGGNDFILDGGTDPSLGADLLDGGSGGDILYVTGGHDTLIGGGGDDAAYFAWSAINKDLDITLKAAGAKGYTLRGDGAHSARLFDIEAVQFDAGSGDDRIVLEIKSSVVLGGEGRDTLIGSSGSDGLNGGDDNDRLSGGKGDDNLSGGDGTDTAVFQGRLGDYDVLETEYGDFYLVDTRKGSPTGRDDVRDIELFEFSDRTVSAATLADGAGQYRTGTADADVFKGTKSADDFTGYGGNDTLRGEDGNDTLDGGDGKDFLVGGDGNDEIAGGLGNDIVKTGDGRDIVTFNEDFGRDVIDDFTDGKDVLSFEGHTKVDRFKDLSIKQDGRDVVIRVDDDRIVLSDTKLKSIDADDFLF